MQSVSNKPIFYPVAETVPNEVIRNKGDDSKNKKAGGQTETPLKTGFKKKLSTRSGKSYNCVTLRCGWQGGYEPGGCLSGKEILSQVNRPFINVTGNYRAKSLPIEAMRTAGVPESVLEIFELANQLGAADRPGAGDASVTAKELLHAEECLGRDQLPALEAAWSLMEVGDVDGIHPSESLIALYDLVIDRSIRPQERELSRVAVSIDSLPKSARKNAAAARRISTGQEDGVVTMQDLEVAFAAIDKTTPAQRKQFDPEGGTLFECVRQLAASKELVSPRARVELPKLENSLNQIVDTDCLEIFQKTYLEAGGQLDLPSEWSTFVRHQDNRNRGCPPPPALSTFRFDITRRHALEIDIPPGHQVVLSAECGHEGSTQVLEGSGVVDKLAPGTYRASVMHDGKIVNEAVFEVCSAVGTEAKDLSAYYGHELTTADGELGVNGSAGPTGIHFTVSDGADRPFPELVDLKHEIPAGRYEGQLHWKAFGTKVDFKLEALSDTTLQVEMQGKTLNLIPAKRPSNAKISGFEPPEMFYQARLTDTFAGANTRFPATVIVDPSNQKLYLVSDQENGCHTGTGWIVNRHLQHMATFDLSKARIA